MWPLFLYIKQLSVVNLKFLGAFALGVVSLVQGIGCA
jgi:hypothetical protein